MTKSEMLTDIPENFKNRHDRKRGRRPYSESTLAVLDFIEREEPYLLLTFDNYNAANRAYQTTRAYVVRNNLNAVVSSDGCQVLVTKVAGRGGKAHG